MARIERFERASRERTTVHETTRCEYLCFDLDGVRILQLDTFGSASRKLTSKVSQSIQLDRAGAKRLIQIIREAYPELS